MRVRVVVMLVLVHAVYVHAYKIVNRSILIPPLD